MPAAGQQQDAAAIGGKARRACTQRHGRGAGALPSALRASASGARSGAAQVGQEQLRLDLGLSSLSDAPRPSSSRWSSIDQSNNRQR
jgi:hypothetical protein